MPAPRPATIANQIGDEISLILLSGGRLLSKEDPKLLALWDQCEKLQAVDVVNASGLKADLCQLAGDMDGVRYWANNAARNGARFLAQVTLQAACANLGFVREAAKAFAELMTVKDGQINNTIVHGLNCGSFAAIVEAAGALERAGGVLGRKDVLMRANQARAALEALGVPEEQLQAVMEQAGEIMRQRRLLWLNESPDVITSETAAAPFVALNYRIDVTPGEAASMTWELAERLSELGLMPPSVTVGFIGQAKSRGAART